MCLLRASVGTYRSCGVELHLSNLENIQKIFHLQLSKSVDPREQCPVAVIFNDFSTARVEQVAPNVHWRVARGRRTRR